MAIVVLPPQVAATIAAGEVVERPASVVKELVENAIDAGARSIRVEIERGGLDLIRVTDDGCGIAGDELALACQRHATSKLRSAEDLTRLTTLGFRGEALPSIVGAADVQLQSRLPAAASGAAVRFRGGELVEQVVAAGAGGTSVTVRSLFARQPARLKFLRTPASEAAQITAAVQPFALAYPELRFALHIDGRCVLQTTGSGDRRDAAGRLLGAETAAALLEIVSDSSQGEVAIRGLVGPPAITRATRTGINIFVNRRWVQPRRLSFAVEQAYDTLLTSGRHPVAIVEIELPPADVDVNVHPTKAELRFRDERAVYGAVLRAVRATVLRHGPVPSFQLDQGSCSGSSAGAPMTESAAIAGLGAPLILDRPQPTQPLLWQAMHPAEHDAPSARDSGTAGPLRLPLLRVVGQTGGTYVVAEGPTGMYLIDQHAAHERVLYERITAQQAGTGLEVQGLLAPIAQTLTPQQAAALTSFRELLAVYGFTVEPFGDQTVLLRALPAFFVGRDAGKALVELLDALAEERQAPDDDRLRRTLACHGSVRAGKTLALDEMRELVLQLEACESPRTCPHGRPTMVHLSTAVLEREFKRR